MSEAMQPVPALGGVAMAEGLSARIEEVTDRGMITLRCALEHAGPALETAGFALPAQRRVTLQDDRMAVWMAPDELLLCLPRDAVAEALAALAQAFDGRRHLALDASDARATFRLTGAGARQTLAKGAPVDMAAFAAGEARRSHLGQVAAAFWMTAADPDVLELVCFRSVAAYVFEWLVVSADQDAAVGRF